MFGIVIDKTTKFVLDKCVIVSAYNPKDNEEVVLYEYELGNPVGSMNKPQLVNGEWIDTEPLPPIQEEDKITILLLNGSTGVLKFEKKDNIVFVTGNVMAEQYTTIGNIPSNLYPKESITLNGLIITSEGKILFNKQYDEINGFYII